jgi:hypothetical protein
MDNLAVDAAFDHPIINDLQLLFWATKNSFAQSSGVQTNYISCGY